MVDSAQRPLRADARRNRDLILAAATHAFTERGLDATMDAIAKEAGVGAGTLYRHFPTREALIEAAYRNELAAVCDAAGELLETLPPEQAFRAWMDRFMDYMTTKQGMAGALQSVIASGVDPFSETHVRLDSAINLLLAASVASGDLRADIAANDVLMAVASIAVTAGNPAMREQAGRLLDLLMDGLRYRG